jgi:hypothetical protein
MHARTIPRLLLLALLLRIAIIHLKQTERVATFDRLPLLSAAFGKLNLPRNA